jgi:hypothetical protein
MWRKFGFAILFLLIVWFGFFVRTARIADIPAGLFCDEADVGYNAYMLLTTGHDEYGKVLPIFFKSFGQYVGPVQIYSTVPFVWLYGLNEYATRLPSALYGVLGIFVLYLLVKELFRKESYAVSLAVLSALLLAITPWHIQFSRVSLDGLTAFVFFTVLGLYWFLVAQRKIWFLPFSILAFAIGLYSYFVARIFVPIFGLVLFVMYIRFFLKHVRMTVFCSFLVTLLLAPLVMNVLSSDGVVHWKQVSIFYNPPKDESVAERMVANYFRHYSVDFLFLKGDAGMPGQYITRHSVKHFGEFYFFEFPLVLVGIYFLYKRHRKSKVFYILLFWLLLFPIGSIVSADESPQATRSIIGVIPFTILAALGLWYLSDLWKRKLKYFYFVYPLFCSIIIFISFITYLYALIITYPTYSSDYWGWQFGPRDILHYFVAHKTVYDDMFMMPNFNAPEVFLKFYTQNTCQNCKLGVPAGSYDVHRKQLFAVTPDYLNSTKNQFVYKPIGVIDYPGGSQAFILTEIVSKKKN